MGEGEGKLTEKRGEFLPEGGNGQGVLQEKKGVGGKGGLRKKASFCSTWGGGKGDRRGFKNGKGFGRESAVPVRTLLKGGGKTSVGKRTNEKKKEWKLNRKGILNKGKGKCSS